MRCYFCPANLTAVEMGRGNVCTRCSTERNGGPSKSERFLAAHPELRTFRDAFGARRRSIPTDAQEAAMRFNARRMREKAHTETHVCRAVRY